MYRFLLIWFLSAHVTLYIFHILYCAFCTTHISHLSIPEVGMCVNAINSMHGLGKLHGSIEVLGDMNHIHYLKNNYEMFFKFCCNVMLQHEHAHWALLHPYNLVEKDFVNAIVLT